MDLIVTNDKVRQRDGSPHRFGYKNATYRIEGEMLIIEHREGETKPIIKSMIPMRNVIEISEHEHIQPEVPAPRGKH